MEIDSRSVLDDTRVADAKQYFRSKYLSAYNHLGDEFPFDVQVKHYIEKNIDEIKDCFEEFQDLMNSWGESESRYKKMFLEMLEYQYMPNKIEFEPLCLEIAQRNIGKPIPYYYANGGDPTGPFGPDMVTDVKDRNDRKEVFSTEVIITSPDLIHEHKRKRTVYPNWLHDPSTFTIEPKMFLFLKAKFEWTDDDEEGFIQISDPLRDGPYKGIRILSDNSINGDNWVEKGKY